jgi:aminopeptidase C
MELLKQKGSCAKMKEKSHKENFTHILEIVRKYGIVCESQGRESMISGKSQAWHDLVSERMLLSEQIYIEIDRIFSHLTEWANDEE